MPEIITIKSIAINTCSLKAVAGVKLKKTKTFIILIDIYRLRYYKMKNININAP